MCNIQTHVKDINVTLLLLVVVVVIVVVVVVVVVVSSSFLLLNETDRFDRWEEMSIMSKIS